VAGAPPDQYSTTGQRWGFPCYNWPEHKKDNFAWWRGRIAYAQRYFSAYRIDHVLGFFRLWSIKQSDDGAVLGFFNPSIAINHSDLGHLGFDGAKINWFSQPHINCDEAKNVFNNDYDYLMKHIFEMTAVGDMLLFKTTITGSSQLNNLPISNQSCTKLKNYYNNRALLQIDDNFYPTWFYKQSRAYLSLNKDERGQFDNLVMRKNRLSEELWGNEASQILGCMAQSSHMLICAEDLGVMASVVPQVLQKLNILSLRVMRWAREWDKNPATFEALNRYPAQAVATTSVHDCSTLRQWWHETEIEERELALTALNLPISLAKESYTTNLALAFIKAFNSLCTSRLVILPLQDYLALSNNYRTLNSTDERINTPGTASHLNWRYCMPVTLQTLLNDKKLSLLIATLNK
jgi:4-alpha-glucanotransferase